MKPPSQNDIMGTYLLSKASTDAYRDNWDNIFGKAKKEQVVEETQEYPAMWEASDFSGGETDCFNFDLERMKNAVNSGTVSIEQVRAEKAAIVAEEAAQSAEANLVETLRAEFPLFDEDGLDEFVHCCETVILKERKRLHRILNGLNN